jgi:hypothetical protein
MRRMGEKRNECRMLVGKPEGKRQLGRPRLRWVDNIVAYLLEVRTVKAEKQPLLGNCPYTRGGGTRHARCDVTQQ